ncbi:unnamed protein product [Arabidopsis thaliana]|uniref:(thale cress) hypothetical protein n=1 Tax=Arabidopsis thaliana TaxID=3702 RepID=A0A7G2DYE0_ARATH|nr:unnamed protein product [Arabidopsis thaliana]
MNSSGGTKRLRIGIGDGQCQRRYVMNLTSVEATRIAIRLQIPYATALKASSQRTQPNGMRKIAEVVVLGTPVLTVRWTSF